jgi:hypothetical protein
MRMRRIRRIRLIRRSISLGGRRKRRRRRRVLLIVRRRVMMLRIILRRRRGRSRPGSRRACSSNSYKTNRKIRPKAKAKPNISISIADDQLIYTFIIIY